MKLCCPILLIVCATALISCHSNEINYNDHTQNFCSADNKPLLRLNIRAIDTISQFEVVWHDAIKNAPSCIHLFPLTSGYVILSGWKRELVGATDFHLLKSKRYSVELAQGDASPYTIEIRTDEAGLILTGARLRR